MERWYGVPKPKPPAPRGRGYDYPSFSSTLLDSIYRSIDEDATGRGAPDPPPPPKSGNKKQNHEWAPHVHAWPKKHAHRHQQLRSTATTSSSSDCSSYGGYFSSSEPESATTIRLKPIRTQTQPPQTRARSNPAQPLPPPIPIPSPPEKKKKNLNNSIRSKFRDLKKSRSPTSPAARLASFLNSLFTTAPGTARKQKIAVSGEASACSTACSRSCLVKTPSTVEHAVKRSVRFAAVPEVKKMNWRGFERREEEEDDDVASDSSSDLFELENLSAVGRYRDELPVYETTHLGGLIL